MTVFDTAPSTQPTLAHMLRVRVEQTPDAPAYRECPGKDQPWVEWSWGEVGAAVTRWRGALQHSGVLHGDRVGIWLPNSMAAMCADQAALQLGAIPVPVHTTDNPASIAYIFDNAEIGLLVLSSVAQWERLRTTDYPMATLHTVVVLGEAPVPPVPPTVQSAVADADATQPRGPRVVALADWLRAGEALAQADAPALPQASDVAAIVYTSGTTGKPKGVMLTHANVVADVHAFVQRLQPQVRDKFLSFLPLSHTFERTVGYYLGVASGACTAYARSAALLMQDMLTEQPTIVVCVPRIYERLHAKLLPTDPAEAQAYTQAVEWGWAHFCQRQGIGMLHPHDAALIGTPAPAAHTVWQRQIAAVFGGAVRMAITGGGSMPHSIAKDLLALGVPLLQGYGMTETSPVIAVNELDSNDPATVGTPLPCVQVRIGAQQELQVRGAIVMKGYWKRPEATAAAFTEDGWLRTGDQAELVHGRVRLLGRIKEIIVTSTGEKISPADVEGALLADPLVEQVMLLGDHRPYVAAMVVLHAETWDLWAAQQGWDANDPATLELPAVVQAVLQRLQRQSTEFPRYAQPRAVLLLREPWTVENALLTPTLKIKRQQLLARYAEQINRLYGARR